MELANEVVEDEPGQRPRNVVDSRRRGHRTETCEENGDVDVAPEGKGIAAGEEVEGDREEDADGEEKQKAGVSLSDVKHVLRSKTSPDDGGGEPSHRSRAAEAVLLLGRADIRDIHEHPVLNEGAKDGGDDSSDDLDREHGARGNLHVVAKLEVTSKTNGLGGRDESDGLEEHVGDGSSREHVSSDEFMEDLGWDLLVRDGLQHGKGER